MDRWIDSLRNRKYRDVRLDPYHSLHKRTYFYYARAIFNDTCNVSQRVSHSQSPILGCCGLPGLPDCVYGQSVQQDAP